MNWIEDRMRIFYENRVVNWHEHVWFTPDMKLDEKRCEGLIEDAWRTGTDMLVCSLLLLQQKVTPDEFRLCNDTLAQALQRHPNEMRGYAFVNPGYRKEALDEIRRCVEVYGMIGVKLYYHYLISDPAVCDVIELCIDMNLPILVHATKLNYHPWEQPFASNGEHFALAAREYPEATFVMAHISGGGDWEWSLKAIEDCPNVLTDISGSVIDDGIVEKTVSMLGAERVLFGTDGSYAACIGKIIGCDLTEEQKKIILNNPRFAHYLEKKM